MLQSKRNADQTAASQMPLKTPEALKQSNERSESKIKIHLTSILIAETICSEMQMASKPVPTNNVAEQTRCAIHKILICVSDFEAKPVVTLAQDVPEAHLFNCIKIAKPTQLIQESSENIR